MRSIFRDFFVKPILALAVAVPVWTVVSVSEADASHKYRRGAVIAGVIIGGAIAYHHYKKRKKHYKYGNYGYSRYGYSRHGYVRRHNHHRRHGYYHRHNRYGHQHFHRY